MLLLDFIYRAPFTFLPLRWEVTIEQKLSSSARHFPVIFTLKKFPGVISLSLLKIVLQIFRNQVSLYFTPVTLILLRSVLDKVLVCQLLGAQIGLGVGKNGHTVTRDLADPRSRRNPRVRYLRKNLPRLCTPSWTLPLCLTKVRSLEVLDPCLCMG